MISPPGIPLEEDDASLSEDDGDASSDEDEIEPLGGRLRFRQRVNVTSSDDDGGGSYDSKDDESWESDDEELMSDAESDTSSVPDLV